MGSEQNEGTSVPCSEPRLCANNCGFWGNAATMNLCSKCYKDFCLSEEHAATAKAAVEISLNAGLAAASTAAAVVVSTPDAATPVEVVATVEGSASEVLKPKPANRCGGCNKKVGLTGFKCRCGMTFCGSHRYPESHNCTFDFKESGREAIAKSNPVVKADKMERF